MDNATLGNWLWQAACSIRGPVDAPKYKDYILPLLFFKRLSDVYEDEVERLAREMGDRGTWPRAAANGFFCVHLASVGGRHTPQ